MRRSGRSRSDRHDALTGPPSLDPGRVDARPGPAWCRDWTARVDGVLQVLATEQDAQRGVAVVALGSYARRELCPGSDVDLLLLHSGWGRADLADLVQRLCYPLWDVGLQVGHAVRTPLDAVRAAGERIDTATALTDRRLVVGDRGLLDDLASRTDRWLRRNAAKVLADLAEADRRRHARAGWRPGMLEPHLKDGAGGLRDLHGLRWAAACLLGEVGLDPLVGARYLGASDRRELAAAGETLLAARCALHLVRGAAGRPPGAEVDRLRLDLQDEVAGRLGVADGDELLRRVGLATRTIAHLHDRTWPLLVEDAAGRRRLRAAVRLGRREHGEDEVGHGLRMRDGGVAFADGLTLAAEPSLGLRALAAAGRRGVGLDRTSAERLRREIADGAQPVWDRAGRTAFVDLLRSGPRSLAALSDADHVGLLVAHLPEWARVRGLPQRNPLHRYDLDTHAVQTVAELVDLAGGAVSDAHERVHAGLAEPEALLVAAFLHDVGKAWEGDHSVVGAELAGAWVRGRMGFGPAVGERVARLVRHHLLLPDVATRRDIDDPEELHRVARLAGDPETLDGLFLLSLADARATGPSAHSPWKDGLIAELHRRVRRVLVDPDPGRTTPPVPVAAEVAAAVRAARPGDRVVERVLAAADGRYLAAAGRDQVLAHADLLGDVAPAVGELRAAVRDGPADGTATITVVAGDRLGLVADCAGVLAADGLQVLDARAFTGDGVAYDWFVVRPRDAGQEEAAPWGRVTDDLRAAGAGTLDVGAALAARARRRDERPPPLAGPVPVDVRIEAGHPVSRIEVHGPDSPGVLSRLARVLATAGVDVLGARVATLGPEVRDVFFVRADPGSFPPSLARDLAAAATPPA